MSKRSIVTDYVLWVFRLKVVCVPVEDIHDIEISAIGRFTVTSPLRHPSKNFGFVSELSHNYFFACKYDFCFPIPTVTTTDSLANKYQKYGKRKCSRIYEAYMILKRRMLTSPIVTVWDC